MMATRSPSPGDMGEGRDGPEEYREEEVVLLTDTKTFCTRIYPGKNTARVVVIVEGKERLHLTHTEVDGVLGALNPDVELEMVNIQGDLYVTVAPFRGIQLLSIRRYYLKGNLVKIYSRAVN